MIPRGAPLPFAVALCTSLAAVPASGAAPPAVRVHVSPPEGLYGNSFWFRTERGSVLVGAPFLADDAVNVRGELERDGAWPPGALVLLSARPESSWGAVPLASAGARVWASRAVADRLRADFGAERTSLLRAGVGLERLPKSPPAPTNTFTTSLNLGFEGFTLRLYEADAGSRPTTVAAIPETGEVFAGDLLSIRTHPLVDGMDVSAWRVALTRLKQLRPRRLYPGRGPAAGPEAIDAFVAYLDAFSELVRGAVRPEKRSLPPRELANLKRQLLRRFPDWLLPAALDRSIPSEYERQRRALLDAGP